MTEEERMAIAAESKEDSKKVKKQLILVGKRQTSQNPMTVEILRTYRGMENLSDQEGEAVILTLKRFTALAFKAYQLQKQHRIVKRAA